MKALIISTSDLAGGAAIAANRLHRGLVAAGVDSRMLVQDKRSSDERVVVHEPQDESSKTWLRSLSLYLNKHARAGVSNTTFSLPWPGTRLADHPLVQWADVINLHWVSGFVSPETVRELLALGKPVVWTLHDQRPFTGGCHYASGCEGFVSQCNACPQLQDEYQSIPSQVLQLGLQALEGMPPLTVVTPSQWLGQEAQRSRLLGGCRVEVIPYGIDLEVFKPTDRAAARATLGLPEDALVLMFGAFTLQEYRKGFDLLSQAIAQVLKDDRIAALQAAGKLVFAAYGKDEKTIRKSGLPVRLLGEMDNEPQMAATLSAADLIICPTREDNLPNVVMEAMACAVPVLSCRVGGVPDMVEDSKHGRVVPGEDSSALAEALRELILNSSALKSWGQAARTKCEAEYPLLLQGERYLSLFQSLTPQVAKSGRQETTLQVTQSKLLAALAEAQGRQVEHLTAANQSLVQRAREAETKVNAKPTAKAALKIVEQELKSRRASGWFSLFSPTIWALRQVRSILRKATH